MNTIILCHSIVTEPDFDGLFYYVAWDEKFNPVDYADTFGIDCDEINTDDIMAVHNEVKELEQGQWLKITHSAPN